jgi:hypothetical protein
MCVPRRRWQRPNNEVMRAVVGCVARQRPVGNNGVEFSLGSILKVCCGGKIVLEQAHVNLYIRVFTNNERIMTKTNDRPDLSSEGAHDIGKTVSVKPKLMSGHETHMGLESRTY